MISWDMYMVYAHNRGEGDRDGGRWLGICTGGMKEVSGVGEGGFICTFTFGGGTRVTIMAIFTPCGVAFGSHPSLLMPSQVQHPVFSVFCRYVVLCSTAEGNSER